MERKHFLKNMFIGAASAPVILAACKKTSATDTGSGLALAAEAVLFHQQKLQDLFLPSHLRHLCVRIFVTTEQGLPLPLR